MYKEMIDTYETAKATVVTLTNTLSSATNAEEKQQLKQNLSDAQKEVEKLYTQIKGVEVLSEFVLGQVIQGDDKTRITLSVGATDNTVFPSFDENGEEVMTTHFGVSSRWFLALTAGICPVSALILDQVPDIKRTIKPNLFSIYNGAKIKLVRKIALKGEKRKVGEGTYSSNQFVLDRVLALDVKLDVKNEFEKLRFDMWQRALENPYNEITQSNAVSSLFKLS